MNIIIFERRGITCRLSAMLLLLFTFIPLYAQAPAGNKLVTVRVVDATRKTPLAYAHVVTQTQPPVVAHTDLKGLCTVTIPLANPVTVKVTFVGFEPQQLQLNPNENLVEVGLHPLNLQLELVEVVGQRKLLAPTSTTERLGDELVQRSQTQTLANLLATLPGMRTLSTGALIEKPVMEGMSGNRIVITDNNSKLTGQDWADDHAPEIAIPSYAKVEVVKGAESVRFGANAIGGVVRINTDLNNLALPNQYSSTTSYSSNGHRWGQELVLERNPCFSPDMRYRVNYKYQRSGDYQTSEYPLFNTGSKIHSLRSDFLYKKNAYTLQAHLNHYSAVLGIFTGSHVGSLEQLLFLFKEGRPSDSFTAPFSYNIIPPKQDVQHTTAIVDVQRAISEHANAEFRYAFQRDYRKEYDMRRGDYEDTPDFAFKLYTHSLQGVYKRFWENNSSLQLGASALLANNISDTDTGSVPVIPNYTAQELGVYGIYLRPITHKLQAEFGIRADAKHIWSKGFDWNGESYGGKKHYYSVSGSAGIKHQLTNQDEWYSNIGLAWRPPEPNELYAKGIHHGEAVYLQGNLDLRTEKAFKWTSGYTHKGHWFQANAHGFINYIRDYIYDIPRYLTVDGKRQVDVFNTLAGPFPIFYYLSSNGVFVGGDLSVTIEPFRELKYMVRGEWMRAYNLSTNGYFPNIPPDRYTQRLNYRHQIKTGHVVSLGVEHLWVTKQMQFDPDIDLMPDSPPAYALLGADFSYQCTLANRTHIEVYCTGHNLLNKLYKDYNNRMRFFAHDKGRDISLGVRLNF